MTDKKFQLGIKNAVETCMNVTSTDRVVILTDRQTAAIGNALAEKAQENGAETTTLQLEDFGPRPLTAVPPRLLDQVISKQPTVTFFAAESQPGEVGMRMDLSREIREFFKSRALDVPRHGHMVSITKQLIREGMTADYRKVHQLTLKVATLLKGASRIQVSSSKGTDLTAEINPAYKWVPCHGLYHAPGDWGNLPEGEVFTCPGQVNGIVVADVLGDYFSPRYGVLAEPVVVEIKDSVVTRVWSENTPLADEFQDYLNSAENGTRVGEFAIGTNTAVTRLTGNLLQDEKIPGIHVAFGNPSGHETGADWTSNIHVDVVPECCTVEVDGVEILKDGQFLI